MKVELTPVLPQIYQPSKVKNNPNLCDPCHAGTGV